MSAQSKYYDRAAECQRLMYLSFDPRAKATFKQLRDLWIEFANEAGLSQSLVARVRERIFIDLDQNQKGRPSYQERR